MVALWVSKMSKSQICLSVNPLLEQIFKKYTSNGILVIAHVGFIKILT